MQDRTRLADSGIFIAVVIIDSKTGRVRKSPDIISRGLIYLRDNQGLLQKARQMIKRSVEAKITSNKNVEFDVIKKDLSDKIGKFITQHTEKSPIIIPVVISV